MHFNLIEYIAWMSYIDKWNICINALKKQKETSAYFDTPYRYSNQIHNIDNLVLADTCL